MNYNEKLLLQLKNIARNATVEKERSRSTLNRWYKISKTAFENLGIDEFKYVNTAKTPSAKQKALSKAANTLIRKVEAQNKRLVKEYEKTLKESIASFKEQAKENLKETTINKRTQKQLFYRGNLPERMDYKSLYNMSLNEVEKLKEKMNIPIEERAKALVEQEAKDFLKDRYFAGLLGTEQPTPGVDDRINSIINSFGDNYVKLKMVMERINSPAFKGGYDDTDKVSKGNTEFNKENVMLERLDKLEQEISDGSIYEL